MPSGVRSRTVLSFCSKLYYSAQKNMFTATLIVAFFVLALCFLLRSFSVNSGNHAAMVECQTWMELEFLQK